MAEQLWSESDKQQDQSLIIAVFVGLFMFVIGGYYLSVRSSLSNKKNTEETENNEYESTSKKSQQNQNIKALNPKKIAPKKQKAVKDVGVSHKLLVASLKGHTGEVISLDISSNGKFMASCSEDRTIRLWNIKDFEGKDHKYSRVNVEFDHATSISFSPDSRAFIISLATDRTIRVFKIHKEKKDGSSSISITHEFDFPKVHKADIISVAISSNGKYIMSADRETQIILWNFKGEVLEKIDTLLMYNTAASISPCGNLVAACGFTADVKLWYVELTKTGEFKQVTKCLEIKGHSAGVLGFSFTNDSKRLATVSKDGTWKIWDINVNYLKGQDAYLLHTCAYDGYQDGVKVQVAMTHDYFVVALSIGRTIQYYNIKDEELKETLKDVHQGSITGIRWTSDSRMLVSAGGVDKIIRVWHNPPGVEASLSDLKEKLLKTKSDSVKDRINQQIEEARDYLENFS